jgi:hypothetical protein
VDIQEWTEKKEDQIVFRFSQDHTNILQKLIKTEKWNGISTPFQSKRIVKCRMIADRLNIKWLHKFLDHVEDYQSRTGWPDPNKEMLLRAIIFERQQQAERARYIGLADTGQGQIQSK